MFLAERFSLEELCHVNEDGRNALSYAEVYCKRGLIQERRPWIEVARFIKQQMEAKARRFEGSLIELMELARCARAGLDRNLALLRRAHAIFGL